MDFLEDFKELVSVPELQDRDKKLYKSTRKWVAVLYPENMISGWQDKIYRILQVPFAYIIHDKDEIEELDDESHSLQRKTHIHLLIVYGNTTTYQSALDLFNCLSATGKRCCNTCQPVRSVSFLWSYFCHRTPDSKDKFQYPLEARITGNNFDLGQLLEQDETSVSECLQVMSKYMINNHITTFTKLLRVAFSGKFDNLLSDNDINVSAFDFCRRFKPFFAEVAKGVYLDYQERKEEAKEANASL